MLISYDQIAPRYENNIQPLERWFLRDLRKEAIAALPPNGRILELGAGTGLNLPFYAADLRGVALEPSAGMLQLAIHKPKPAALTFVQGCGERLPFASDTFDALLATLVLCSVQSPEEVFAEIRRVVRTGGTVSLLEHVRPQNALGPVFDLMSLITVPLFGDHMNRRTSKLAELSGLKIDRVRPVGFGILNVITCVV
jgi:ubiquinone/menaquinone biosynthesis C-methylase UbiE